MAKHKALCGAQYTVKINGRKWVKFCTKAKGHWGRHGS